MGLSIIANQWAQPGAASSPPKNTKTNPQFLLNPILSKIGKAYMTEPGEFKDGMMEVSSSGIDDETSGR